MVNIDNSKHVSSNCYINTWSWASARKYRRSNPAKVRPYLSSPDIPKSITIIIKT